ncbi:MAG TPA: hypothetical protein VGD40_18715 [Chryseosolibacter sp.]
MEIKTYIVIWVLSIVQSGALCQSLTKSNFIGEWTLTKHVTTIDGISKSYPVADTPTTYTFYKNGKVSCSYFAGDKHNQFQGRWQLLSAGKKVRINLFDLKEIPANPMNVLSDYHLIILRFEKEEFDTEEFLFTEETPGVSTFTRLR